MAYSRPWGSSFIAEADINLGPTPEPRALVLADLNGKSNGALTEGVTARCGMCYKEWSLYSSQVTDSMTWSPSLVSLFR